jgi:AraC-type transcriptional regulator N-terminus
MSAAGIPRIQAREDVNDAMAEPVPPGPALAPGAAELRRHIARLADGWTRPRPVDGVTVFSTTRTTSPLGGVAEPVFALVAQGAKRSVLGDRAFDYAAGQFLVVTLDLPLTSSITVASAAEPFLGLSMPLDPAIIAELLIEADLPAQAAPPGLALSVSDATAELIDAVVRLLRLAGTPHDQRILSPAVKREIHWWLLTGPQGGLVRQVGVAGSRIALVGRAIAWIRAHYDEPVRVDDLATKVGLSVSSLNRHFRTATAQPGGRGGHRTRRRLHQRLAVQPRVPPPVRYSPGRDAASSRTQAAPPG